MSNKDSLPSMSGDLTLPKKDEIKFADYRSRFTPLPLYDMGELGDRIGAAVRYNVSPSFSIGVSVERSTMPRPDSFHDTYMQAPGRER